MAFDRSTVEVLDYDADFVKTVSVLLVDAPSGTTRELASMLSKVRRPETLYPVDKTVGPKETRGAEIEGSRIHSIRLPSYTIAVEIIFGEMDERLTIRHDAGSGVTPYLHGTILAIRKVKDRIGLTRGLETILD